MEKQHLLGPGCLLNEKGGLYEAGYAKALVRDYDRADIRKSALRIKEWDYYCIMQGPVAFCLTVADNGYMGMNSVTLLNMDTGEETTVSPMSFMPLGKLKLPATSAEGVTAAAYGGSDLRFETVNGVRTLTARMDNFGGKLLSARITLTGEPKDSMVIATPFAGHPKHFYYNQKINCLQAEGEVRVGDRCFTFSKEQGAMAVLDWGRGVWTYNNTWFWSSLSGRADDGRTVGFNLGCGFGDTSAASENMLFTDGAASKLGRVDFGIPQKDGKDDFLSPWHFTDDEGRLDLTFTPAYDRKSCTNALIILSDQHQVFGRFSGTIIADDGSVVRLTNQTGFAEKVHNRW